MQTKHGELVPRSDRSQRSRSMTYYVAENASLTIYPYDTFRSGYYSLASLLIGGVLGWALFVWTNDVRSSEVELALLRAVQERPVERTRVIIMPSAYGVENTAVAQDLTFDTKQEAVSFAESEAVVPVIQRLESTPISITRTLAHPIDNSVARAIVLAKQQEFASAERTLLAQYRRGNTNQQLLYALASLYSKQRLWKKAALSYEQACTKYKPSAGCYYNLAVSYDHLKKRHKAREFYRLSLSLHDSSLSALDNESIRRRITELSQW